MTRVITLFSGYDSQCLALKRLGVDYELVAWCEIDKHACRAHDALFPQWAGRNVGDISKVDWAAWHKDHPGQIDLLTYSSPCQDFSQAGLQRGGEEGSGTRSGLLWEVEKAIAELRPRALVFENVAALVSEKFITLFNHWQTRLNGYGYTNFQQLMNAKDYGVPQNRLRIFMVSILDCTAAYYFPKPFRLEKRLKDVLEQDVEERYYLKEEQVEKLMAGLDREMVPQSGRVYSDEGISPTLDASAPDHNRRVQIAEPQIDILGQLSSSQNSRIIGTEGISPAVINGEKDGMPKIVEPAIIDDVFYDREPRVYDTVSPTIRSSHDIFKVAEPQMLGWTRNEKGEITDRHPVSVANCVTAAKRDNTQNYVMETTIASIKSRDKDNPTGVRTANNGNFAQRLELKPDGTSNTLTSVAKDNLLIEPTIIDATNDFSEEEKRTYAEYSPALRSSRSGLMATEGIRIRRLTERELFRLMDVDEADIDILLSAGIAKTQLAKLAGNSIVVACLEGIFRNLFVDTEPAAGTQTKLF